MLERQIRPKREFINKSEINDLAIIVGVTRDFIGPEIIQCERSASSSCFAGSSPGTSGTWPRPPKEMS